MHSCYILIFEKFDKVFTFAILLLNLLEFGKLIPCIVFITFFIYMASVNQVERCDKTFVMVVAHIRNWSRVDYAFYFY